MARNELDLITMGRIGVDLYPLQTNRKLSEVSAFGKFLGGSSTNVAVAASRLGLATATISRTGQDPFGDYIRAQLRQFGVEDRWVTPVNNLPTPITFCEIFPPDDFPLYFYRQPKAPDLEIEPDELDLEAINAARIFWMTGTGLCADPSRTATLTALAHRTSGHTVFDLDWRPMFWTTPETARRYYQEALRHATVAVGNVDEVEIATGEREPAEAAAKLLSYGLDLAIVKQGPKGVLAMTSDGDTVEVPPLPVEVLNGLGAGDAFGGALCLGLLSGWDPTRMMRYANAAGAIVASRLECSSAMPEREEVEAALTAGRVNPTDRPSNGDPALGGRLAHPAAPGGGLPKAEQPAAESPGPTQPQPQSQSQADVRGRAGVPPQDTSGTPHRMTRLWSSKAGRASSGRGGTPARPRPTSEGQAHDGTYDVPNPGALARLRAEHPEAVEQAAATRPRRPLLPTPHSRLMIIAADHPARGALAAGDRPFAMADRADLLGRLCLALSRPGVDGVLASADVLDDLLLLGALDDRIVIGSMNRGGLAGAAFESDDRFTGYRPQDLRTRGFDAGKLLLRIDHDDPGDGSVRTLEAAARAVDAMADSHLPVFVEPFLSTRDPRSGQFRNDLSPDAVIRSMAIASGLGGSSAYTWLKLPVTDDPDPDAMARVMATSTLPAVLLGGDIKDGDQEATYEKWRGALQLPTVQGLVVGRSLLYPVDGNVARAVDTAVGLLH